MTDISEREALAVSMTNLVTEMAKALVDNPDDVIVQAAIEGEAIVLSLRVAPADLGKVIGKQGRTARSIRTILSAASTKAQQRFSLDIQRLDEPSS